ncbi:PadR family transcriptional regulator [Erythrobacter sp. W53]|uniref:PadR family transcriptional regulator n=1 Tax=Erythrobacter sp. W53 TaxID=3425947 RepID=UPI003D769523
MHGRKWRKMRRNQAWPFIAMMAANSRGWGAGGPFGSDGPFGPGGPFGRGGGGGRRRRRGRVFGSGELRLTLLMLIGDESRHGYELIKAIGDATGGNYEPSPGAVYPTLALLADEGVIKEAKGKGDDARKAFEITKSGKEELAEREEEIAAIIAKLTAMQGGDEEQKGAPELFRAMGNLAGVLKHKYRGGNFGKDDVEEIVDLIDDLAKKIERL